LTKQIRVAHFIHRISIGCGDVAGDSAGFQATKYAGPGLSSVPDEAGNTQD